MLLLRLLQQQQQQYYNYRRGSFKGIIIFSLAARYDFSAAAAEAAAATEAAATEAAAETAAVAGQQNNIRTESKIKQQ